MSENDKVVRILSCLKREAKLLLWQTRLTNHSKSFAQTMGSSLGCCDSEKVEEAGYDQEQLNLFILIIYK